MTPGFLDQLKTDFAYICSADFTESAVVTDGRTTVTLPCLFDEAVAHFDPDTESHVLYRGSRMTVAESATTFNLRRGGLLVTVRGQNFKVRASDWEYDGLGQLVIYLNPQPVNAQPSAGAANPEDFRTAEITLANLVPPLTNVFQLPAMPRGGTLRLVLHGQQLPFEAFSDNRDTTFAILDPTFMPGPGETLDCTFAAY